MANTKTNTKTSKNSKISKTKKSKKTTTKRKSKKETVEPVETAPEVSEPVQEPVEQTEEKTESTESTEVNEDEKWNTVLSELATSQTLTIKQVRLQIKARKLLAQMYKKRIKTLKKQKSKRGGGNQKKNPSGFNKPTDITPALGKFLSTQITSKLLKDFEKVLKMNPSKNKKALDKFGKFNHEEVVKKLKEGGQFARTEVTSMIHMYIKAKQLQDPNDGRKFNLSKETKLKTLLNVPDDVTPTYFNLQSYLSPHFVKA